jgi:hypothetical protein
MFSVNAKLKPTQKVKLFRQLYGWKDKSQYGKYEYKRDGLLNGIPHIRLSRAAIIVLSKHKSIITRYLRGKAKIETRQVILNEKDKKILVENNNED